MTTCPVSQMKKKCLFLHSKLLSVLQFWSQLLLNVHLVLLSTVTLSLLEALLITNITMAVTNIEWTDQEINNTCLTLEVNDLKPVILKHSNCRTYCPVFRSNMLSWHTIKKNPSTFGQIRQTLCKVSHCGKVYWL